MIRFFTVVLITGLFGINPLYAQGFNVELTLSDPVDEYFQPGDTLIAQLVMTDDNGDTIRADEIGGNGLQRLSSG